ncbi:hypothetical protein RHMOL_Rhmol02G0134100 [Rhododendron molle]|uniref:Uncharacterized protein n=1 Tax=Rhododendron molle TaxID=49168 RepID=A0ACC0PR45_RHOML|nr:hypothetical protein RHMOL_Rhmol02G0134100 [Rhododendron molle]
MDEEVKSKKSRETGTFTGEAWKRIRSELIRLTGLINLRGNSKKRDAILPCCAVYLETRLPLEHMLTLQTKSLLVVIVRIQNFSLKMSQKLKVLKVLYVASMTNTDEKFTDKSRL